MIVTPRAAFVLAENPNVMTLEGTNTWILKEPGASRSVVVDPGPLIEEHLDAVLEIAGEVALTLITHHHWDHTDAAQRFYERSGAPTRAVDPGFCKDAEPLIDGENISVDGLHLRILATPGHTADSVSIHLVDDRSLLTGDTILGRGTTIIAYPDGHLGPYLDSLALLTELVERESITKLLPAHGPVIDHPLEVLKFYHQHRLERLEQVRRALNSGASTAREVVEMVYADVDVSLWPAAERSVQAQLEYLSSSN